MILTKRQEDIILSLSKQNDYIKGSELASILNVSIRTIRNDISSINSQQDNPIILASKATGYKLSSQYYTDNTINFEQELTLNERISFILVQLAITFPNKINIYDLSDELYISEFTVISDFTALKTLLLSLNNPFINVSREGDNIFLEGDIKQLGKIFTLIVKSNINSLDNSINPIFFKNCNINQLSFKLATYLKESKFFSRYISFLDLVLYLALILERSFNGVELSNFNEYDTLNDEYIFSKNLISFLESNFNVIVSDSNTTLLINMLDSTLSLEKKELSIINETIHTDNLEVILKYIFKEIYEIYLIDFTQFNDIFNDLLTHIRIAISRINEGFIIINPLKEQLRNEYPFLLDIAIKIGQRLYETLNVTFSTDELCYIVSYLGVALSRIDKISDLKKNLKVLIIVLEGKAVLSHILRTLENTYLNNNIEFKGISNIFELSNIKSNDDYHLIISTTDLLYTGLNTNLIIHQSFNAINQFNVKNLINPALLKIKELNFELIFSHFFKREFFMINENYENETDILNHICIDLKIKDYIDDSFLPSVLERENLISTSLDTGVALPHATNAKSIKTCIYVINCKKPISWNGEKIKSIFLFAINKQDYSRLSLIYDFIINVVSTSNSVYLLSKCKTFSEFKKFLHDEYISI